MYRNKRLLLLIIFAAASTFLIKFSYALGHAQLQESSAERKLNVIEFKDMPVEVKVKNLQSKTWHKDLEIEVKNISKRPIYFILAYLTFPDDTPPSNSDDVGFALHYGKRENIRISHLADPADEHLAPGEKYIFTFPERERIGFEARHKKYPGRDKNLRFWIALVSFGDGTGWELGEPRDKRKKPPALGAATEQPLKKRS